jgi:trimeric autotransporter adhesin
LDVAGIEHKLHEQQNTRGPDGRPLPDPMANPFMQQAQQEKSQIVYTGFIAQEVEKAAQSLGYQFSGVDQPKDDQQSFYGLRYSDFVVPLVKAAQELSEKDDSLKAADSIISSRLDRIERLLGIDSNARSTASLAPGLARLFQNAPNPCNQNTLIQYYIPRNSGSASLHITGMHGEIFKIIAVSGSGFGQVEVQTDQLASGTYTYSLFVDRKLIDTKKMVVIK